MDGVIVDTEPVHRYAYFQQFTELNIDVTECLHLLQGTQLNVFKI
jgi:beta-phosphoglucomutase-like phosphatase (HAD superfamily)